MDGRRILRLAHFVWGPEFCLMKNESVLRIPGLERESFRLVLFSPDRKKQPPINADERRWNPEY
jgi:hypothetical protein